jgi:hypothetical protein
VSTPGSESKHRCGTSATILWKSWDFWENRLLEIMFYEVSWCLMSSLVTPNTQGSLHTCPGSISRSLICDDFWWISGVLMWGECFVPLLIRRMSAPSLTFSILTLMIFDVDSNCVHPRFWIRALMMENRHAFVKILRFLRKSTSWNQVLWTLVVSDIIPGDS